LIEFGESILIEFGEKERTIATNLNSYLRSYQKKNKKNGNNNEFWRIICNNNNSK
jgi:hypothetical protein